MMGQREQTAQTGGTTSSARAVGIWVLSNPVKLTLVVVLGVVLGATGFQAYRWLTFFDDSREAFDPQAAAVAMESPPTTIDPAVAEEALAMERQLEELEMLADIRANREPRHHVQKRFEIPTAVSPQLPDDMFTSIVLIGSDASGVLADVIIDVLLPSDGSAPIMVSIPRDLYLQNACTGGYKRINASLGGCKGLASGPELLALNISTFTGIEVDHYARVTFRGFARVVDLMGGATVCVGDHPVRDDKSGLALDAGCHLADGSTTLAWVRSRNPEYFIDGEWTKPGGSDFDRQRKQQNVLFEMGQKLASYSSVAALTGALENLSGSVKIDSGWSLGEIASLAFRYRGLGRSDVVTVRIPISNYRTGGGAAVLIPERSFNAVLGGVYSKAAR